MRLQPPTALFLPLLLCACAVETGNEAGQGGETNAAPSAPANTSPGAPANGETVPGQPSSGAQAPELAGEVVLSAAPTQTTEGATVTLTLRNGSNEQIGYNLCTSTLETGAGAPVPTSRVCTMELRLLEPGRTATDPYELPVNMLAGSYRFVTQVERMPSGRRGGVRSNSIEVRSD